VPAMLAIAYPEARSAPITSPLCRLFVSRASPRVPSRTRLGATNLAVTQQKISRLAGPHWLKQWLDEWLEANGIDR